jgi:hypothetical protein
MKKLLAGIAVVSIFAVAALAFAHGPGGWGYGSHMMGIGYPGGHMMTGYGVDQKFLDETADLRKELHNKRFEYLEARRNPESTTETLSKLEKEIRDLQDRINEKLPPIAYESSNRYGHCW